MIIPQGFGETLQKCCCVRIAFQCAIGYGFVHCVYAYPLDVGVRLQAMWYIICGIIWWR